MKQFFSRKWVRVFLTHLLLLSVVGLIVSAVSLLLGSTCPTYLIFGICCPFCGMTRAHLAALQLDFASAFYYHPVFFTGLPFLWMLIHQQLFTKKWARVLWWVLIMILGTALGVTYIVRVCTLGFDFFA
ncbi:MAG: DUF2752 domain-containing protein [Clostridia bacterium]|nr:DUF2752 domain-containing protein [Clostridia bacterium]